MASRTLSGVTQYVLAPNNITFAYRHLNPSAQGVPLVMHIHFRSNMDFWDPLLVDNLASKQPVILFDQAGTGRSTGEIPLTYQGWAADLITFVSALNLKQIDLFGFSMGGRCAQMVALAAPNLVRKLIIAGSGPSAPVGEPPKDRWRSIVWPRDVAPEKPLQLLSRASSRTEIEEAIAISFFPDTPAGKAAAAQYFTRIHVRKDGMFDLLDQGKTRAQREASYEWTQQNPSNSCKRLSELKMPVLILNGDDDVLIPTSQSWELLRGIETAQLIIYPKAGHGFLWQYATRVARDINVFLNEDLDDVIGALL